MRARLGVPPKTDTDWQAWGFDHQASHDAIREAIQAQGGPSLAPQIIYPIPLAAMRVFLANNQQLHVDMTGVTRQQSVDLEDVDLKDAKQLEAWINVHVQNHWDVESALGIAS